MKKFEDLMSVKNEIENISDSEAKEFQEFVPNVTGDINKKDENTIYNIKNFSNSASSLFNSEISIENLNILGHVEDIRKIYSLVDVVILPSWREGMPRSLIEAMMMELPVVATNIRGSREEVVEGETGFLVPVKNVNRLHEKLEYLVNNPEIRKRIGRSGRSRAMRLYDEDVVINRQLELISKYTIND